MEQKTTLSQSIEAAKQKNQYDASCNTITGYSVMEQNLFGNVKENKAHYVTKKVEKHN